VVIDITARKEAERQAERIFETSQDLILVTDRYGKYLKVSPSSRTLLGYRPEEMIGRGGQDFVFSEDLEATRNEMRAMRRGRLIRNFKSNNGTLSAVDVQNEEHERYERELFIKVHRVEPTPKDIGPLPEFAKQAQAAYKVLAATGGGSIRSLSHDADVNQQVMILVFGDKWQEEVSRFASR